jgi:DNA transformation protein and related proteins
MDARDKSFKDFVLDQLAGIGDVEARRMFGGFGLYQDETFFGVIHKGKLFFKIDQSTVGEYRKRKMKPFRPNAEQTLKSYYQVPAEIVEDADELRQWAVQATERQLRNRKA